MPHTSVRYYLAGGSVNAFSAHHCLNNHLQEHPTAVREKYRKRATLLMQSQVAAGHPSVGRAPVDQPSGQVESSSFSCISKIFIIHRSGGKCEGRTQGGEAAGEVSC